MTGKFSPFVIKALVDTITGGAGNDNASPIGIYRSGPKIEQFFLNCGLDMRIGASSRVPATTDFLRRAANHPDGNAEVYLTRIIEQVCDPRTYLEHLTERPLYASISTRLSEPTNWLSLSSAERLF